MILQKLEVEGFRCLKRKIFFARWNNCNAAGSKR